METIFESQQKELKISVVRDSDQLLRMVVSVPFWIASFESVFQIDSLIDALQVARQEFANALYCGQETVDGAPF